MVDDAEQDLSRAVGVTSVQAWRGTFGGEPHPDGTPFTFDAVVIEFGVDVGAIPPLFVPVEAVPGLAEVLLEAANGPNAEVGDGTGAEPDADAGEAPSGPAEGLPDLLPAVDSIEDAEGSVGGEEWAALLAQPRHAAAEVGRAGAPGRPGVYAWFRGDVPVHLGRATGKHGLRARLGGDVLVGDTDLRRSPFRRTVADHVGVAVTEADGETRVSPDGAAAIDAWIAGCTVAWLACATPEMALDLEGALAAEHRPSLSGAG